MKLHSRATKGFVLRACASFIGALCFGYFVSNVAGVSCMV